MSNQAAKSRMQLTSLPNSQSYGSFSVLPKEIREMIYSSVLATGSVALTRASKALHSDTKRALYRHGIFRVHIEADQKSATFPDKYLANVENLQVKISFNQGATSGLTASMLGARLGTKCRTIHLQLAKSLISCKNYYVEFPADIVISRTASLFEDLKYVESLKNNDRGFLLSILRSMTLEFYLDVSPLFLSTYVPIDRAP